MPALAAETRSLFEKEVIRARETAETAARAALTTLAVERDKPFDSLSEPQRALRRALRARARQLGQGHMPAGMTLLVEEIAYEQWHRMLFARFLAENGLLMHPEGVAVTLAECAELAQEEGAEDLWAVATRYAAAMLPGIFRTDDPALAVRFAPEGRHKLEQIVAGLPRAVFTSDDGLGWSYQFWQSGKKKEVNASERKIGGADIAPVTQLFTEEYMVRFLLENTLGAWWAARRPDSPLNKTFEYLRYRDDGAPAAGTFDGWPDSVAAMTMMDPCGGSGHFIVAAFDMLRRMRMEAEGLSAAEAGDAVIRDNVHMLELDLRCSQIAAFNLALAAWKSGGYRPLPPANVACSGSPVAGQLEDWLKLAGGDAELRRGLARLYELFKHAPDLGSLIDPAAAFAHDPLFGVDFERLAPLLHQALAGKNGDAEPDAALFETAVAEAARAAEMLAGKYTLVTTNVPYLGIRKQSATLRQFIDQNYRDSRADLATVFIERCVKFADPNGSIAVVSPQNWFFLGTYEPLRRRLLQEISWNLIARLGVNAFGVITGWVVNVTLTVATRTSPSEDHIVWGTDVADMNGPSLKDNGLKFGPLGPVVQRNNLNNPDARITLQQQEIGSLLQEYASCYAGILNGDTPRFIRQFWEVAEYGDLWTYLQSTVEQTVLYGGRERIIFYDSKNGHLRESADIRRERLHDSDQRGNKAWGKKGIAISQIGQFPVTVYSGEKYDSNVAVLCPEEQAIVPALWAFCSSLEFGIAVRHIDQKLNVTNATFAKVPFDLAHWQKVAAEQYPDGLPPPHSNDPTQWLFKGHPVNSTDPLQVAVARLLGYRWPEQGAESRGAGEPGSRGEGTGEDALDALADDDGIVCLPGVGGEEPAHERLRRLLAAAYGDDWSPARQDALLAAAGYGGRSLAEWLRDAFFAQHCKLFHNRPFIWHVWDGRKDGFSALLNTHKLDHARLERLIYTTLGDWIASQRAAAERGVAGADGRLVAALALKKKLELILAGEPPHDIYVRWKPPHEQPIGWRPDLNDGVRLNIRPWVTAGVLRAKFTINWNKDRGQNPDGSERLNDRHLSRAEKEAARRAALDKSINDAQ